MCESIQIAKRQARCTTNIDMYQTKFESIQETHDEGWYGSYESIQLMYQTTCLTIPYVQTCSFLFDESIISSFNIIFKSVLFIFEFILFKFISFLELFYYNCILLYFRNKYSKNWVLEQKKGELELIRAKNIKKSYTKISGARIEDKNMNISYKNIMCKEFEDLVQIYTRGAPTLVLLLLLLFGQATY